MKNKRLIAAMILVLTLQMITGGIVAETGPDSNLPLEQTQHEEIIETAEEPVEESQAPAEETPTVAEEPAAEAPAEEIPETAEEPAAEMPAEETPAPANEVPAAIEEPAAEVPAEETLAPAEEIPEAAEEPAAEEPIAEEPAEEDEQLELGVPLYEILDEQFPGRKITIYAYWGENDYVEIGDDVRLTAQLTGYEGLEYSLRWQFSANGQGTWSDLGSAMGNAYSFQVNEANYYWFWRIAVDITGVTQ